MRAVEGVRLALAASFFSRGWAAALSLLAVPFYLRFLGVEAYGVVGIFASLSAMVSFLDLGLGATLTREMAKVPGGQAQPVQARDAARTFELVYAVSALLVGLVGASLAYPLGMVWVTVEALSREEVTQALVLASVALACQWPGNLYSAGLTGLQCQVRLSVATIVLGTLRVVLTLSVIWWCPTVQAFFSAQIALALLQTGVMRNMFWTALGGGGEIPKFRWEIVRASLSFSGGMALIALTSIVQTQTDKLVLSRALSLPEFGVYSVVSALASGLYMVISPLFSVMFPRFSSSVHRGDERELIDQYHASSQLIAALVVPPAMLLAVFGQEVLYVWTGDRMLGTAGAGALLFLSVGNACNGLVNMPYALQLAYGWTRLMLWINMGSILLLVPGIWWAAAHYGAMGGAAVWALLNFGYLLLLPQIMHKRILRSEKVAWYGAGILLPISVCAVLFLIFRQIVLADLARIEIAVLLSFYWCISTFVVILALPQLRRRVVNWWNTRGHY